MDFNEYQLEASRTAIYPNKGSNLAYPALGINGEAGEIAEKVKKILRDKGGVLTNEDRQSLAKECGDCLWYLVAIANEIGISLGEIAEMNIEKLKSRQERGVLTGSGDNR